ncbi:MAG: hypothetical protein ABUS47_14495 [Steroidobacter sp.]
MSFKKPITLNPVEGDSLSDSGQCYPALALTRRNDTLSVIAKTSVIRPSRSEGKEVPLHASQTDKRVSFRNVIHDALPITQQDYFTLVDTTGRLIREDKAGHISSELKPILKRFNIDPEQFMDQVQHFHERYAHCAGSADNITSFARRFKRRWGKGVQRARQMYQEAA